MESCFPILLCGLCFMSLVLQISYALDSISAGQNITDGQTIVSAGGNFELGFFSPSNSKNRYVGISYEKLSTGRVVWVANRENPLKDSSGVLKLTPEGVLILLNLTDGVVWSSNVSRLAQNPIAQLLDSANFVVKEENDNDLGNAIWQSFDHPCNSLLADMKLGKDREKGLDRYLTSWKSRDDPSPGDFTYRLDTSGYPQLILMNRSVVQSSSGPWNGIRFSGIPQLTQNAVFGFGLVFNQNEIYYYFNLLKSSVPSILVLNENGIVERFNWVDRTQGWILYSSPQTDDCDTYASCGGNGSCNIATSPKCMCLTGFVPKDPSNWEFGDWSNGCVRRTELDCPGGDKFLKYTQVKLPDTRQSWFNERMNLQECEQTCLRNCSCTAYSNLDIRGQGSGCLLWFGVLMDIRLVNDNVQEFYVRMAASEVGSSFSGNTGARKSTGIIVGTVLSAVLLLGIAAVFTKYRKDGQIFGFSHQSRSEDLDLPMFGLTTLVNATGNFSEDNKLGEGGFGAVYKGVLKNDQEIAVKRLSENSRQGQVEFKNEVAYIAKLQHRNLIKILGCCIQVDEMMLIYEFLPNRSLDCFIFDQERGVSLDWPRRFTIINGVALGLLYLHRDSRLRIIHRDLKAENILLDNEMNPKISDFGLARSFGGNESEANTKRVVGTFGYMSPEYAINGFYSVKSDVFSFGVLVLEIVSGKRNRGFNHPDKCLSLLGYAWTLSRDQKFMELVNPSIASAFNPVEVLRSIHVALLCVQNNPHDRPEMSSVVMMLNSESTLPQPKQPGFFYETSASEASSSSDSRHKKYSANEITISHLLPR
ncbi:G-type lectin S-receptor-like serine/threonine-protein kinase At4g27290 isoform X1 [Eucalyptus grandis]|uniref:G-type lectin S-receptor-like serine/threonine-protein kinase At4g27290 isoform X1 n=1 Tax=Eucalyptus grandis TaxID=71139 RepID=UPI00192EBA67|nr:G-type lectin S-receptor-like serine/threonine-protein kinase At4g27290 isoform X1 [Eucalyptus grandis]XP_018733094.2 G-type lectin S-receptor-like serine/threonine-protein kinase At4g27290 isoform X1 [Eucalyptus grandis]XP_039164415.1 G-type lectin S-receptor-like serine/threonine-protein kinase At4g27290 isoform X1 [Eucalyptus grandis]